MQLCLTEMSVPLVTSVLILAVLYWPQHGKQINGGGGGGLFGKFQLKRNRGKVAKKSLTLCSSAVTITARFNNHKFYVLPTQCIYVFCVDLRTNSDYFPIQH
jgi:hypothetical protein